MFSFFKNFLLVSHGFNNINTKYSPKILEPLLNGENIVSFKTQYNIIDNLQEINKQSQKYSESSLFIGGDSSLSVGTISGIYKPNMKIIIITPSIKNIYKKKYQNAEYIFSDNNLLQIPQLEDILFIGLDEFYNETYNYIKFNTPSTIIKEEILDFVGDNPVHISFDVRSIERCYFKSCSSDYYKGLSIIKIKYIFDVIFKYCKLNSMDITEINFINSNSFQIFEDYSVLKLITDKYNIFK